MDLLLTSSINKIQSRRNRAYVLFVLMIENPKTVRRNVLHTTGNVVLELATTVIQPFNYTRINVKAQLTKNMLGQVIHHKRNLIFLVLKQLSGLKLEVYLLGLLLIYKSVRVLSICHKPVRPRTLSSLIIMSAINLLM